MRDSAATTVAIRGQSGCGSAGRGPTGFRARIARALEIAKADGRTPVESEVIALAISFGYGTKGN